MRTLHKACSVLDIMPTHEAWGMERVACEQAHLTRCSTSSTKRCGSFSGDSRTQHVRNRLPPAGPPLLTWHPCSAGAAAAAIAESGTEQLPASLIVCALPGSSEAAHVFKGADAVGDMSSGSGSRAMSSRNAGSRTCTALEGLPQYQGDTAARQNRLRVDRLLHMLHADGCHSLSCPLCSLPHLGSTGTPW